MSDLDRRIAEALSGLPDPDAAVTARARRLALDATAPPVRSRRRALVVPAVVAVGAAATGAALAAAGGLDLRGRTAPPVIAATAAPPLGVLRLPDGIDGLAVLTGGRAWSRTHTGLAIEGLGASAMELSPNGKYLAAGMGDSLVALTPAGARVWSQPTAGPVIAASWAPNPNPIYVAYVVRTAGTTELRLIEGDGDHDRLLARGVAARRPEWRSDALRLWFRWPGGGSGGIDLATGRVLRSAEVPETVFTPDSRAKASGHFRRIRPGWRIRADAPTELGTVVAASPDVPAARPTTTAVWLEVWLLPKATTQPASLLLRTRAPLQAPVALSVR